MLETPVLIIARQKTLVSFSVHNRQCSNSETANEASQGPMKQLRKISLPLASGCSRSSLALPSVCIFSPLQIQVYVFRVRLRDWYWILVNIPEMESSHLKSKRPLLTIIRHNSRIVKLTFHQIMFYVQDFFYLSLESENGRYQNRIGNHFANCNYNNHIRIILNLCYDEISIPIYSTMEHHNVPNRKIIWNFKIGKRHYGVFFQCNIGLDIWLSGVY